MKFINTLKRKYLQSLELNNIKNFDFSIDDRQIINSHKILFEQISKKHQEYVHSISSPEMAMSLELANFILSYCIVRKPKNVMDLGSGFSSFIFRFYKKNIDSSINVFSIDDSADWLKKTKDYLLENDLDTNGLYTLEEVLAKNKTNEFDVVLLDLNFVEIRKNYIQYSYELLRDKGFLIIDDVHKVEFLRDVKQFFKSQNKEMFNLKKHTYDNFLRFAIAVIK